MARNDPEEVARAPYEREKQSRYTVGMLMIV
jgi:hypothetical protein